MPGIGALALTGGPPRALAFALASPANVAYFALASAFHLAESQKTQSVCEEKTAAEEHEQWKKMELNGF